MIQHDLKHRASANAVERRNMTARRLERRAVSQLRCWCMDSLKCSRCIARQRVFGIGLAHGDVGWGGRGHSVALAKGAFDRFMHLLEEFIQYLHVQLIRLLSPLHNEPESRRCILPHQFINHAVRRQGIGDFDAEKPSRLRV